MAFLSREDAAYPMTGQRWLLSAWTLTIVALMVLLALVSLPATSLAGLGAGTVAHSSATAAATTATTATTATPTATASAPAQASPLTTSSVPHLSIPGLPVGTPHPLDRSQFGKVEVAQDLGVVHLPDFRSATPTAPDPLVIAPRSTPFTYTNGTLGWNALNNKAPNNCGCTPPDTTGSVGAGYVMETVNSAYEIWTTSGTVVSSGTMDALLNTSCTSNCLSDPNIHYDPISGRWFAEMISVSNYGDAYLGVSTSSSPLVWHTYLVHMPNHTGTSGDLPDQINVGVGANTISLSGNDFAGGATFAGAVIFVINKSQALAGTAPTYLIVGPWAAYASVHAAEMLSLSSTIYFLSSNMQSSSQLNYVALSGAPPSAYHFTFKNFSTTSTAPGGAPMPSGGTVVTNDNRIGSAVWRAGDMWAAANDGSCSGGAASCVHLWQVNTTTASLVQDFIWTPSGENAFYPAVTLDSSQNMGLLYSFSSSTSYPSVAISGQAVTDATGTIETPTVVQKGTAAGSAATRFGDYSGAATDLSSQTMWGFGEWTGKHGCTGSGCYEWDTWVQSWSFGGGGGGGLTVSTPTPSPSSVDLGTSVSWSVTVTGGTSPYSYVWSTTPSAGMGCSASSISTVTCTPTAAGSYTMTVTVTDSAAHTASATSPSFSVYALPTATAPTATPASADVGQSVTFSTTASGGSGLGWKR